MTIRPLSQRDPRWAKKTLGFSRLTIGGWGCTLVSLTMLLNYVESKNYTPDYVNDKLRAVKAFSGALLLWANVPKAFPSLRFIKRAYNYSNTDVAWNVYVKRMPVLVEVNGAKIGAPRHWVLFTGNGRMNDPWFGDTRSTSFYPLTGYSVFSK